MLHARLITTVHADHQHGVQVGDVARGQSQRLDLGQLPIGRFRWYESPESDEGGIDRMRPIAFAGVRRVPMSDRHTANHGGHHSPVGSVHVCGVISRVLCVDVGATTVAVFVRVIVRIIFYISVSIFVHPRVVHVVGGLEARRAHV